MFHSSPLSDTPSEPATQGLCITLNGQPYRTFAGDLAGVLRELAIPETTAAVELNGTIIVRTAFAETALASGDVLELVRFVGGG